MKTSLEAAGTHLTLIKAVTDAQGATGAGLTALGDTRLANLDAAVSSRSTYAGADTAGTTTLLARLSAAWAAQLDAAVAAAYGWQDWRADMPDDEILRRLLALNHACRRAPA